MVAKTEADDGNLQITKKIETRNKEVPLTYKGYVPSAPDRGTETVVSSVIAVNGNSSSDLNCQQCDYKASSQSHMK